MKKLLTYIAPLAMLFFIACKEEPPYINYSPQYVTYETTYVDLANVPTPQLREVLIEDISGVRCPNCPEATYTVNSLKKDYPGRVNAITIYPNTPALNSLTMPVNKPSEGFVSKYDLRTDIGAQILATLGTPNSLPNGYVDRKIYAGKPARFIDYTEWLARLLEEKDSVTPVNIGLTTSYEADGTLDADLTLKFTANLSGDYYITLALVQDSIIDVQEYTDPNIGATYNANYAHRHVLRSMFTSSLGDKLNTPTIVLERGRVVIKRYSLLLGPEPNKPAWDKNHMEIVAFVHRGSDGVVVQSKSFEVTE